MTAEGFWRAFSSTRLTTPTALLFIDHIKDDPDAFYRMGDDGKLSPLPYDQVDQSYWED